MHGIQATLPPQLELIFICMEVHIFVQTLSHVVVIHLHAKQMNPFIWKDKKL